MPTLTEPAAPPPAAADLPTVLVVDDSQVDRRLAGRLIEKAGGWRVAYAADGQEALDLIAVSPPHVVLTDLQMPGMDGLALVQAVRERHPRLPVVLMTGQGSEEVAVAALRAGAASYVSKRTRATDLVPAVEQVFAATVSAAGRDRVLRCLTGRTVRYELESDPSLVGPLVAALRDELVAVGVCDDHEAMRAGIALEEALLNAIYHGNLEVSSDLKRDDDAVFHRAAAERRREEPYMSRRVRVGMRLTPAEATVVITDEGPGFDVSDLPDPGDPEALLRPSGRGVVMMRLLMDEVSYNATGNSVTMIKRRR
jgi:CheY-like chemotaxis protein/anti-sigma regulatory factor (Ser/Thr protein kinase)